MSNSQFDIWRLDPENWKYYCFYFNKNDDRLMVSKRLEWTGVTFNYAKKAAWIWTIALFIFFGIILYFAANY